MFAEVLKQVIFAVVFMYFGCATFTHNIDLQTNVQDVTVH